MTAFPTRDLDEWRKVINRIDQISPLISMMLEFETRTGLRNGDVGALKFSDLMVNGVVKRSFTIVQSKGKNMRINRAKKPMTLAAAKEASKISIVVNDELKELIEQIYEYNGEHSLVFQSRHHHAKIGRPITRQYINRVLGKVATEMKLPYQLTTHSMRKTFAQLLIKNKAHVKHISEALGHSSVAVTDLYLRTFDDEAGKFVAKVSLPVNGDLI